MVLLLSLVMGACSSSEDTDDAKPTTGQSDKTPTTDKDKTYTVTFDLNYEEATGTPPVAQTIKKGEKATAPTAPTRDGYTFDNWYTDDATTKVFAFTTPITGDMTLYAGWQKITTYTVTFDLNYKEATGTPPTAQTVAKDDNATAPTPPERTSYTFDNWYDDKTAGNKFAFGTTPITADITLYAKWICPAREARKKLTHVVPLYNEGATDASYLPEKLRGTFVDGSAATFYVLTPQIPTPPAGKANQLPYISPLSHLPPGADTLTFLTGGFEITPDYIDASFQHPTTAENPTVRISCYSMKQVSDTLYFYYGKVRFLFGQETEAYNKSMYAWTGINKNDPANEDALYGYMVSIQGSYLRPLYIYPFVGGIYTRASDGKTVTFPRTEAEYAALTLEDLQIIATGHLTSDKLFARYPGSPVDGIY